MKIDYIYLKKDDITFVTPFIGCNYSNKIFSIYIGFIFWVIGIEF